MRYKITPVPKPRQTRSDKWKKRPSVMRYRAFADQVRAEGVTLYPGAKVCFYIPMPKSWSKKKRDEMDGQPHTQKPDLDNLIKALLDAIYEDDCGIWCLGMSSKIWAYDGAVQVVNDGI